MRILDQDALEGPIPRSFFLFNVVNPSHPPPLWGCFGGFRGGSGLCAHEDSRSGSSGGSEGPIPLSFFIFFWYDVMTPCDPLPTLGVIGRG